jgi:hypothetical protein
MHSDNELIVYYTPWSNSQNIAQQHFLGRSNIYSLHSYFFEKRNKDLKNKGYHTCPAFQNSFKNVFYFKQPLTTSIKFNKDGFIVKEQDYQLYIDRASSIVNSFACDLDFGWIFYSEEDLDIRWTDTYMHNTISKQFGFLNSGGLNISKWFRPLNLTYHLWEGVDEFRTEQDDAAAYIEFLTDKKIILKPFYLNQEIIDLAKYCDLNLKDKPNQSLSNLYKNFEKNNIKKLLTKEIKKSIIV